MLTLGYFTREEFACQCGECGFNVVDTELLYILNCIRGYYNSPVTITSGCRCRSHNAHIGGATNSKHCLGLAADIRVAGVSPSIVFKFLEARYAGLYGIGAGMTFTHVDIRERPARWKY